MVSRFFSAIGEVLAPTLHTPLEDFRLHWRAIKNFYIDDKDDVEGEGIPEHLNQMIQALLVEADAYDGGRRGTGPCLEFFLQERILPILCHLGETDRPPGMRVYVMVGVSTVVRNMPGGLLFNMHVHEPIRRLLATAASGNDHAEVISLVHAVVVNIGKEKVGCGLGTLFLHPPDAPQPDFVLLSVLLPRIELPGVDGELARQTLVQIVSVCQHEPALHAHLAAVPAIAHAALPRLFRALPMRLAPSAPVATPAMEALVRHLNFYSSLTKAAHMELRQELLRVFEDEFVLAVLGPALLQPNEEDLAVSTRYVSYIVDHTEPPLLHALLNSIFPIGQSSVEESMGILAASITTRVASANEDVRRFDLQLIDNAFHQALPLLVCPSASSALLASASNGAATDAAAGIEAARAYLALFPACDAAPNGYDGYLADAHYALSARPSTPMSPSTLSSPSAALPGLYSGEPLVQALWQQVDSFLDQSLDTNLVLTSAIGKMALHPHPAIRSYLFGPASAVSLYGPLKRVSERAKKRCDELGLLASYQDALDLLRARLGGEDDGSTSSTATANGVVSDGDTDAKAKATAGKNESGGDGEQAEEKRRAMREAEAKEEARRRGEQVLGTPHVEKLMQALLLLQEFEKEIAATLHASALLAGNNSDSNGNSSSNGSASSGVHPARASSSPTLARGAVGGTGSPSTSTSMSRILSFS